MTNHADPDQLASEEALVQEDQGKQKLKMSGFLFH